MSGATNESPPICEECLCCIRHYNGLCPGLIVFSREGCREASAGWRAERDAKQ